MGPNGIMSNSILITGASGFIGSAVTRLCVDSMRTGRLRFWDDRPVEHVVALCRPGGSLKRLQELPLSDSWSVEYANLTHHRELKVLLGNVNPRAILHLAVHGIRTPDPSEDENRRVIVDSLETMFESLAGTPGARLIHTSSARVLEGGDQLDEDAPLDPKSVYEYNKVMADRSLSVLRAQTGVDWINLRLFNIFGKYEHESQLLPHLVSKLYYDNIAEIHAGDLIRDFTDVDDVAQVYVGALSAGEDAVCKLYHIGSGNGTTIREFAIAVGQAMGKTHLIRPGKGKVLYAYPSRLVADPARARRWLDWYTSEPLYMRIQRAVKWWQDVLKKCETSS
jgi:dolichol-phosphate mannosyltransferase